MAAGAPAVSRRGLLAAAALLAGAAAPPVRIGVLAARGSELAEGFLLAASGGTLGGVAVQPVFGDDGGDPARALAIVRTWIDTDPMRIFLGASRPEAARAVLESGAVFLDVGPGGAGCDAGYWALAWQAETPWEMAGVLARRRGFRRVAVRGGADAAAAVARGFGGAVEGDGPAEAVVLAGDGAPPGVAAAIRTTAPAGWLGITNWLPEGGGTGNANFVADFRARHGRLPGLAAAMAYDAGLALSAALFGGTDVTDAEAFRQHMFPALFLSVRGRFRFAPDQHAVQDWFAAEPAGGAWRRGEALGREVADRFGPACRM